MSNGALRGRGRGRAFAGRLLPPLCAGAILAAAPVVAAQTVVRGSIGADATWEGTLTVAGRLVVKRGATLTILPGTSVRFAWLDEDGDGIGDGELAVEGRLVARGTAERPILFASARAAPAPKDWTYVMISASRGSVVEHCVFEHAFTGLQLHLSSASVRRCRFRDNFEALRFSTSEIAIECNEISGNAYGIRYESRGSTGSITGNTVSGNEHGFFPVVKSGPGVRITGNNIVNRGYNVKVGAEQREDLDFRGNWWGTADPAAIAAGFFDGRREGSIGRVLFEPYLERAVEPCGIE
ncbi:MAG TPA: right-handed parallel beta-helix repeat-containing protein [Candidatus Methanoperedens sp.]|nr:right-handed parallel beta-helix repeat-containing protein [Candidatus Methanoperedens sp.]